MLRDSRLPQRFWDKVAVDPVTGCWLWTGAISNCGYGQYRERGKTVGAHRHCYSQLVAEPVLELDHLCRVRHCVNPAHLEPVDHATNIRRGDLRRRLTTHCKRGHEYAGENLLVSSGKRYCRACLRLRASRRKEKPE